MFYTKHLIVLIILINLSLTGAQVETDDCSEQFEASWCWARKVYWIVIHTQICLTDALTDDLKIWPASWKRTEETMDKVIDCSRRGKSLFYKRWVRSKKWKNCLYNIKHHAIDDCIRKAELNATLELTCDERFKNIGY